MPLLWLSQLRYLRTHPWLMALAVLGVAVGVAGLVAMDLARHSAARSFELTAEALSGRTTHQIVGGPLGVPETLYRDLRLNHGVRPSAPVVEGLITAAGRTYRLLGVDPFVEGPFRPYAATEGGNHVEALWEPGQVFLTRASARALGVKLGDPIPLADGQQLRAAGLLTPQDGLADEALQGILVADIATAQEVVGHPGRLTRIDLILDPDQARRLKAWLPPGVELVTSASRTQALRGMTAAFFLNLQALSLLSLLVSALLIYNVLTFTVVQRQPLLARLRTLGVTRRELGRLILAESCALCLLGVALGEPLGVLLGRGMLRLVTRSIDDLYFSLEVTRLDLDLPLLLKAGLLALAVALLAAALPARWAARTSPRDTLSRSMLEQGARRTAWRAAGLGLALLVVGWVGLLTTAALVWSLAGMFLVMAGLALLTPAGVIGLNRALMAVLGGRLPVTLRLAVRGLEGSLSRTGVALAALMVAISATVGIGVMVDSFRGSFLVWLERTLSADVYLARADHSDQTLPPDLIERARQLGGISLVRHATLGEVELVGVELDPRGRAAYQLLEGQSEPAWAALEQGAVWLSEPYAYHHRLHQGDRLPLRTHDGLKDFPVAGVFHDYASDTGYVLMSRKVLEQEFEDPGVTAVALYLPASAQLEAVVEQLRQAIGARPISVRSNRALKQLSLEIFERTFEVTGVLRMLAVLVAFVGIVSALMALQLERVRELAVLRALGMTVGELRAQVLTQTALSGLWAGLLAIPAGLLQAYCMVEFINRRAFGWTLGFQVSPRFVLEAPGLALLAALLAGGVAAATLGRIPVLAGLREE